MKTKMTHSMLWKSLAFALSLLLALLALFCAGSVTLFTGEEYYLGNRTDYAQSSLFRRAAGYYSGAAWIRYTEGARAPEQPRAFDNFDKILDPANTNYRYDIFIVNAEDHHADRVAGTAAAWVSFEEAQFFGAVRYYSEEGQEGYVVSTLDPAMAVADVFARQARFFDGLLAMRYWLIAIAALSVIGMILLFVYLMRAAGRYPNVENPECRALNRISFDLYAALCVALVVLLAASVESVSRSSLSNEPIITLVLAVGVSIYAVLEALCMSLATRIKCRCLLRNTILGWALRLLWHFAKWLCRAGGRIVRALPMLWKTLLSAIIFLTLQVSFAITSLNSGFAAFVLIIIDLAALVGVCLITRQAKRLQAGARALSEGDFSRQIETRGLLPEMKKHAGSLNGIGIGMSRAVEARMKSERMKTDLITNVSHDIKTPLTAIISYADLLKKEPLSPAAMEYSDVLEQQALRLKKLAEDIMEASMASSGTMSVDLQPTNLVEIANQSLAEYAARLTDRQLTPVLSLPETPPIVRADGRLLWRVLDNLLSNAAKYALPGTRVYVAVSGGGEVATARLSMKNISKEPLNIDPAELTERFVRGDAARSTDGSGLGLSIAQDLMALQGGELHLSIDGDLFKAELSMPICL